MNRAAKLQTLHYRRSHFVTQLPVAYLYSPSHYWLSPLEPGRWRVGLTRFATRMLGRMVDHEFEAQDGQAVQPGDRIGWIEGFKAISDVYCAVAGSFAGGHRELREKISVIDKDPYAAGWLYEAEGKPDANCVDVAGYRVRLDKTIDRIIAKQSAHDES